MPQRGIPTGFVDADALNRGPPTPIAAMEIGDHVLYQGQVFILRGFEPMSVPDRHVELEHPETGERLRVPLDQVEERP